MPFPAMIYAADGEVVMLNRAWTQHSGWELKDVPSMDQWFHKGEHDENAWEPADVEALYDWTEPVEEGEQTIHTASGQTRIWDFATTSIGKLADGRQGLMRTAVDVSERTPAAGSAMGDEPADHRHRGSHHRWLCCHGSRDALPRLQQAGGGSVAGQA